MAALHVSLQESTVNGRLYYRNDPEISDRVLVVRSRIPIQPSLCTININNRVMFDIDNDHILTQIELIFSRHAWQVETLPAAPQASRTASLAFPDVVRRSLYVEMPIKVITDEQRTQAYIYFGEIQSGGIWAALSEECLALVIDEQLKAIFVKLH